MKANCSAPAYRQQIAEALYQGLSRYAEASHKDKAGQRQEVVRKAGHLPKRIHEVDAINFARFLHVF